MEHKDIRLWQHDFNQKLGSIITKKWTILRLLKQKNYSELSEVAEAMIKLYDEIKAMSDEIFIELERLTNENQSRHAR